MMKENWLLLDPNPNEASINLSGRAIRDSRDASLTELGDVI